MAVELLGQIPLPLIPKLLQVVSVEQDENVLFNGMPYLMVSLHERVNRADIIVVLRIYYTFT